MSDETRACRCAGELHAVFGSGGMPAVLTGIGATLAFNVAQIDNFASIGGISGGSIPAAFLSAGIAPNEYLPVALELDFLTMVEGRKNFLSIAWAVLNKYRHGMKSRPDKGIWTINGLIKLIDRTVPSWPSRLWVVAASNDGQLLFTSTSVHQYGPRHFGQKLEAPPPSLGAAIGASCAVPGLVDAVHFHGHKLVDGAFSQDGDVPVDAVWRHFGSERKLVLALDVGEEPWKKSSLLQAAWRVCGSKDHEMYRRRPQARPGLAFIDPRMDQFHSLKLRLSKLDRLVAIATGFLSTTETIHAHSLVATTNEDKLNVFSAALTAALHSSNSSKRRLALLEDSFRQQGFII